MLSLEVLDNHVFFETVPIEGALKEEELAKDIRYRYANLIPQKPRTEEEEQIVTTVYPHLWMQPVYVSDILRKKKLTPREQSILIEKVSVAEQNGCHPDCVFCHAPYESY
jgi:tRNA A37 methylthiotransferase MiaB